MNLRAALKMIAASVRANLLPGILLQCLMGVFLFAYATHDGTRRFFAVVAEVKRQAGFPFAFFSYVIAAALLPEALRIVFFQRGRPSRRNLWLFLSAAPAWGMMGVAVDVFYRCQAGWFGDTNSLSSILPKILVDQFLFAPLFSNPLMIGYFALRDAGFRRNACHEIFRPRFYLENVMPVQVAAWMIWIPAVSLIYSMPQLLQVPLAVIIMCFWVLIFTTLGERLARSHKDQRAPGL